MTIENSAPQQNIQGNKGHGLRKAIVMDDTPVVRLVLERLLERIGCKVVCTANGEDTLSVYKETFENDPFDLVLMDLTIGNGLGGKETVRLLKEFDPHARAVVFSGNSLNPVFSEYGKYGFDAALNKPFTYGELTDVIDRLFGSTKQTNG